LHNYIAKQSYLKKETTIGEGSIIDKSSYISKFNVKIGKQVIIEPNVTILPDVEIGDESIVRANSVIGVEGFEFKRTGKRLIGVVHDGRVIIKERVHIGANNTIAKGFMHRDTIIGEETKTDNLVHIAHRVHIGKRCLIAPGVIFAGSITVKNDVFIGLGANINNQVIIDDQAFISIGSVVTRSVKKATQVTGNFAIPHEIFIRNLKKTL
jgi:UDP-3-O-[3-hydroxymyristoyl] glucosamine N-acyltransferase